MSELTKKELEIVAEWKCNTDEDMRQNEAGAYQTVVVSIHNLRLFMRLHASLSSELALARGVVEAATVLRDARAKVGDPCVSWQEAGVYKALAAYDKGAWK
jgi:hypothetical protein